MTKWNYEDIYNPEDYLGFVYKITNLTDGKFYIGKKYFWYNKKKSLVLRIRNALILLFFILILNLSLQIQTQSYFWFISKHKIQTYTMANIGKITQVMDGPLLEYHPNLELGDMVKFMK
jgi:hypothetical protein